MLSSINKTFTCAKCGESSNKWSGKCLNCNAWGTIEESKFIAPRQDNITLGTLSDILAVETQRIASIKEFDHVCGGGIVPGGVILVGGEPGIGKSTLLLQICGAINGISVYVTAEESPNHVKIRGQRLGIDLSKILCTSASNVESIINAIGYHKPSLLVIDSIQTVHSNQIDGTPGSINQIKVCTNILVDWAKNNNIPLIIVGHVTKDGVIAGPKIIEHMVDTVLYFQSDNINDNVRILRSIKNRFGSIDAIGVFEVRNNGLHSVDDASISFIRSDSQHGIGSCMFITTDSNRGLIVEVEALVSKSYLKFPSRYVVGWSSARLLMICSAIEKHCKIILSNKDIQLKIVGGIKINDPSTDLAAAAAIISSCLEIPLPKTTCIFGEISLTGNIRSSSKTEIRLASAKNFGFNQVIMPKHNINENLDKFNDLNLLIFSEIHTLVSWIQKCKI